MPTKKNYQGNQQNYDPKDGEYESGPKGAFSSFGNPNESSKGHEVATLGSSNAPKKKYTYITKSGEKKEFDNIDDATAFAMSGGKDEKEPTPINKTGGIREELAQVNSEGGMDEVVNYLQNEGYNIESASDREARYEKVPKNAKGKYIYTDDMGEEFIVNDFEDLSKNFDFYDELGKSKDNYNDRMEKIIRARGHEGEDAQFIEDTDYLGFGSIDELEKSTFGSNGKPNENKGITPPNDDLKQKHPFLSDASNVLDKGDDYAIEKFGGNYLVHKGNDINKFDSLEEAKSFAKKGATPKSKYSDEELTDTLKHIIYDYYDNDITTKDKWADHLYRNYRMNDNITDPDEQKALKTQIDKIVGNINSNKDVFYLGANKPSKQDDATSSLNKATNDNSDVEPKQTNKLDELIKKYNLGTTEDKEGRFYKGNNVVSSYEELHQKMKEIPSILKKEFGMGASVRKKSGTYTDSYTITLRNKTPDEIRKPYDELTMEEKIKYGRYTLGNRDFDALFFDNAKDANHQQNILKDLGNVYKKDGNVSSAFYNDNTKLAVQFLNEYAKSLNSDHTGRFMPDADYVDAMFFNHIEPATNDWKYHDQWNPAFEEELNKFVEKHS